MSVLRELTALTEARGEYSTFAAWKRAVKKKNPDAWFEGDKDICNAMVGPQPFKRGETKSVGEWDGAKGELFEDVKAAEKTVKDADAKTAKLNKSKSTNKDFSKVGDLATAGKKDDVPELKEDKKEKAWYSHDRKAWEKAVAKLDVDDDGKDFAKYDGKLIAKWYEDRDEGWVLTESQQQTSGLIESIIDMIDLNMDIVLEAGEAIRNPVNRLSMSRVPVVMMSPSDKAFHDLKDKVFGIRNDDPIVAFMLDILGVPMDGSPIRIRTGFMKYDKASKMLFIARFKSDLPGVKERELESKE